jgi:hypothetical protein
MVVSHEGTQPKAERAWYRFWAPQRISWWIALLFLIGSALFTLGGFLATYPNTLSAELHTAVFLNNVFFVGSLFFTAAAYLQLLEAVNADVAEVDRVDLRHPEWRWFVWRPKNAGYLASLIQLVGAVFFNFNTADAMLSGLTWAEEDLLIWTPNILGCLCFLAASYLALVEVSHGFWSFQPRSVSWWIAIINLVGSLGFQISAIFSIGLPVSEPAGWTWFSNFFTFLGGLGFLVGSYLLFPEMFDAAREQRAVDQETLGVSAALAD